MRRLDKKTLDKFGVGNQGGNKFQNIAFCLDIGQR